MLVPLDDLALVALARAGDTDAVAALYERHAPEVRRHLCRFAPSMAPDLCHDTFIKVIEHLPQAREDTDFRPWLLKIATNLALDYVRKASTKNEHFVGLPVDHADEADADHLLLQADETPPDARLLSEERASLIEELLSRVAPRDALSIRMQAAGYTDREIARHLVLPWTAVKSSRFRARAVLTYTVATERERYGPLDSERAARAHGEKQSANHPKRARWHALAPPAVLRETASD